MIVWGNWTWEVRALGMLLFNFNQSTVSLWLMVFLGIEPGILQPQAWESFSEILCCLPSPEFIEFICLVEILSVPSVVKFVNILCRQCHNTHTIYTCGSTHLHFSLSLCSWAGLGRPWLSEAQLTCRPVQTLLLLGLSPYHTLLLLRLFVSQPQRQILECQLASFMRTLGSGLCHLPPLPHTHQGECNPLGSELLHSRNLDLLQKLNFRKPANPLSKEYSEAFCIMFSCKPLRRDWGVSIMVMQRLSCLWL